MHTTSVKDLVDEIWSPITEIATHDARLEGKGGTM